MYKILYIYIYTDMCVCVFLHYIHIHTYIYIYVYIYTESTLQYTYIHIHIHTYIYIYIYLCMYVYMYMYIYIYIYIYRQRRRLPRNQPGPQTPQTLHPAYTLNSESSRDTSLAEQTLQLSARLPVLGGAMPRDILTEKEKQQQWRAVEAFLDSSFCW